MDIDTFNSERKTIEDIHGKKIIDLIREGININESFLTSEEADLASDIALKKQRELPDPNDDVDEDEGREEILYDSKGNIVSIDYENNEE